MAKKTQEIFKRYEKKYLLTTEQYKALLLILTKHMTADQYGKHTICNVYFDTSNYQLIRTSLAKPMYKEKLRLRSYGIPGEADTVFIELKKKFDGIVYKRRIPLTLREATDYLYYGKRPNISRGILENQIINEIDYFMSQYHPSPSAYLAYERMAYAGNEDNELRVTFDCNICCRDFSMELEKGIYGTSILDAGRILMEVKIPGSMPLWMCHAFSELSIFPVSFSKYGTYYKQSLNDKSLFTGGIHCA